MTNSIVKQMDDDKKIEKLKTKSQIEDLYKLKYRISEENKIPVTSVAISPNGQTLAACYSNGKIKIFNLADGNFIKELIGHKKGISDVQFSPVNSNILASCSDDFTIRIWSINNNKCIKILKKHSFYVTVIRFTSKGNILISGSADETIIIWDVIKGDFIKLLVAHSDPILSIALTPDDTIIFSASFDGLIRLFDLESGFCLKTLTSNSVSHGTATLSTNEYINYPISKIEVSPNGKYILSTSFDGVIRLWDYMKNSILKTYTTHDGSHICKKFMSGSKFITKTLTPKIVSGSDSQGIIVWDLQTKEIVFTYTHSESPVSQIETYDLGNILVSSSLDGVINVFDLNKN